MAPGAEPRGHFLSLLGSKNGSKERPCAMSEFSDDEPPVNVSPMLEPDEDAALEHLVLLFGRGA